MSDVIPLKALNGVPRVDSRLIAEQLGVKAHNIFALMKKYQASIEQLGILPFKTGVIQGRGQPEKYALLTEDQAYFLLTLSRNTPKVVALKLNLVKAFKVAREQSETNSKEYLPLYHSLHDEVSRLAQVAKEAGSTTAAHIFHINANKVINAAMGIVSGQRAELNIEQRLLLSILQAVYANTLRRSLMGGDSHKDASRKAKQSVMAYVQSSGVLLLEDAA